MDNTLDFTKKGCLGPYNYYCVCVYVCVSNVFTFFIPSCDVRYYRNDVRFVFTASWLQEGSYLIDVICVCVQWCQTHIVFYLICLRLCFLCAQSCQFLCIVHYRLSLRFSLIFIQLVYQYQVRKVSSHVYQCYGYRHILFL